MGILRKLLGRSEPEPPPEHAVIVRFRAWGNDLNAIFDLETELEAAIASAGVGEFDGNEVATDGSEGSLYMYGPDADRLFSVVRPVLERSSLMRGAVATLRYGSPEDDVPETTIPIGGLGGG